MSGGHTFPPVLEMAPLGHPLAGSIRPPGSKSITNRALVAAALADPAASHLWGALEAEDTILMREGLRELGVLVDDSDDPWLILGTGGSLAPRGESVWAGASGTTARFLMAVAALAPGPVTIDGTARMRLRPMGPLIDALGSLGAQMSTAAAGALPVTVVAGGLRGGVVEVDSTLSSQFVSALLLVAPRAEEPVDLRLRGGNQVASRPYLDGTVDVMRHFGASVDVEDDRFVVAPTGYRKAPLEVEPDASAAVYPAVAAAITAGTVRIEGIPATSIQPDLAVLDVLAEMGCRVERQELAVIVTGPAHGLRGVDADLSGAPDGALAIAVAAVFAAGATRLSGLSTLRHKETDRLAALEKELRRLGAGAEVEASTLTVTPGRLHAAVIETYEDHRMAMAFAVAGFVVPGVAIRDPACVTKTWPGFFADLTDLARPGTEH